MEICGAEYRAFNRTRLICKRPKGHKGAAEGYYHNGFSNTCPICGREGCDGKGEDCKPRREE